VDPGLQTMSKVDNDNLVGRRGVVLGLGRLGMLGLLGGLAVFGEAKRRRLLREGKCVGGGVCDACGSFGDCGLPEAVAVKQGQLDASGKNNVGRMPPLHNEIKPARCRHYSLN
jgi:hypothetical protein